MAVGKNKRLTKGKKGAKKKTVDVMTKKDWYDVKAPSFFNTRQMGKTCVTRTTGTKIASDALLGRVFESNLADLNSGNEELAYRKMRLVCEDVAGKSCLLNFHGMDFTTDRLRGLVRKWQTLIEAFIDVKTSDGYTLRVFAIAFTKKRDNQIRKTTYAQSAQVRQIRQKMFEIIAHDISSSDLKECVQKFIAESISKDIEKACRNIFPLQNVFIRKVKVLKKPKTDLNKLYELHGEVSGKGDSGAKVARDGKDFVEIAPLESV
jgi:small subunit ribosomal protein S3Ae